MKDKLIMISAKQFLLMKIYLELEKLRIKLRKIGDKHGISYNKNEKKVNAWIDIDKGGE